MSIELTNPIENCHKNKPKLSSSKWKSEEDFILIEWVRENGTFQWKECSLKIFSKSPNQCRNRWFAINKQVVHNSKWSFLELYLLYNLYLIFGSKWTKISNFICGRSPVEIKNCFYSSIKKNQSTNYQFNGCLDKNKEIVSLLINEIDKFLESTNEFGISSEHSLLSGFMQDTSFFCIKLYEIENQTISMHANYLLTQLEKEKMEFFCNNFMRKILNSLS